MPLYAVSDERVLALLAAAQATCDVDQAAKQCYVVTHKNGSTVDVPFGASIEQWEAAINVAGSAATPMEPVTPVGHVDHDHDHDEASDAK